MKTIKIMLCAVTLVALGCKDKGEQTVEIASETADGMHETTKPDSLNIQPIEHATMILAYKDAVIYVDPVGGTDLFKDKENPTYVLVTDIHGDHMDPTTLRELDLSNATLIVPQAVADKLPEMTTKETIIMSNGDSKTFDNMSIQAIPMYNLRKEALQFHEKGRGNGYLLTMGDERIYISGDTEDIPEMRNLEDIDIAFVCMNLPYTMTVDSAASAVLDFKPRKVYPYHYRGSDGMSDVDKFKTIVNNQNSDIEVVQLNWYK